MNKLGRRPSSANMAATKVVYVCCVYLLLAAYVPQYAECLDLWGFGANDSNEDYDTPTPAPSDDARWQVRPVTDKNKDANDGIYQLINEQIGAEDPMVTCNPEGIIVTDLIGHITSPFFERWQKGPIHCKWVIKSSFKSDLVIISLESLKIMNSLPVAGCEKRPIHFTRKCCAGNYLKIVEPGNEEIQKPPRELYYCGPLNSSSSIGRVFIARSNPVIIELKSEVMSHTSPSFNLAYSISPRNAQACPDLQFHCPAGHCIPHRWKCNGLNECGDWADEKKCKSPQAMSTAIAPVPANQAIHSCGEDISKSFSESQKCDGVFHCANRFDELGCQQCHSDDLYCSFSNRCIGAQLICNGRSDCGDHSDEINCQGSCPPGLAECGEMRSACYDPHKERCNQVANCPNAFDELNCQRKCPGLVSCADRLKCYNLTERCNGVSQCNDGSDEQGCDEQLCRAERGSKLCPDGLCILSQWSCDPSPPCNEWSTEFRCLKNGLITAFLAGSLFCLAMFVLGASFAWKVIAFRRTQRERRNIDPFYHQHTAAPSMFTPPLPLLTAFDHFQMNPGEMDAPLFHSLLMREPPPSYHQAMGGSYVEQEDAGVNRVYLDFFHRNGRRRSRRNTRSRSSNQTRLQASDDTLGSTAAAAAPASRAPRAAPENTSLMTILRDSFLSRIDSQSSLQVNVGEPSPTAFELNDSNGGKDNDDEGPNSSAAALDGAKDGQHQPQQQESSSPAVNESSATTPTQTLVDSCTIYQSTTSLVVHCDDSVERTSNIDRETISLPSANDAAAVSSRSLPTHFDCDSQPLISHNQIC